MLHLSPCIQTHRMDVLDSYMHYYHRPGKGSLNLVMIHGMPTSGYLWRDVIANINTDASCYAPDLIGMGLSGKPEISYSIFDHISYFDAWMQAMKLEHVVLVLHGWGSLIGFDFLKRYHGQISGVIYYEAHCMPIVDFHDLSLPIQQFHDTLEHIAKHESSLGVYGPDWIEQVLNTASMQDIAKEVIAVYQQAFSHHQDDYRVLLQYIKERPFAKGKTAINDLIASNVDYLNQSEIPKCMLYARPGFMTTMQDVMSCRTNQSNLLQIDLGYAYHFAQETNPDGFAMAIDRFATDIL